MVGKKRGSDKYLFLFLIVLIIVFSFIIIKPFLSPILAGIILAYIFYPFYRLLAKYVKSKNLAALTACILIVAITLLPMFFVTNALIKESFNFYNDAKSQNIDLNLPGPFQEQIIETSIKDMLRRGSLLVVDGLSNFIFSLPRRILDIFIIIFLMFYLFKDGEILINKVRQMLPFDKRTGDLLTKEFSDITFAVVYGLVVTAVVQGIVGGFGFYIFGINNPILWGTVMAVIALIPFLGPFLVWLPIGLLQFAYGDRTAGIGLLLYGVLVISTVDNIIRPKIIGSRAKLHPAVVLIGVVGGIKILGFVGVVAGPLILALMISFLEKYRVSKIASKS